MADPMPPMQSPGESLAYQPISGWAVAGFATGALFTLIVVLSAAFAFVQGAPLFLPTWSLVAAPIGMALSYYGQRHVEASEGTRAGANLAKWGFRLSLISGLIYFSYYFVTRVAVESQAKAFVLDLGEDSGFLPRLLAGANDRTQLNQAFLLGQSPNARSSRPDDELAMRRVFDKPVGKDGGPGMLTQFREGVGGQGGMGVGVLPRVLSKSLAKDAEITPLAVQDWNYEKRSYKIYRKFLIKTREVEMEYLIGVASMEAEGVGQSRKWFVNLTESAPLSIKLTPLGENVSRLRRGAMMTLSETMKGLFEGKGLSSIDKLDRTNWDDLVFEDNQRRDERRAMFHKLLAGDRAYRFQKFEIRTQPEHPGKWEQVEDKIQIQGIFHFALERPGIQFPAYLFEVRATLETVQAVDPARVDADARITWNLIALEVVSSNILTEPKKDGPPGR